LFQTVETATTPRDALSTSWPYILRQNQTVRSLLDKLQHVFILLIVPSKDNYIDKSSSHRLKRAYPDEIAM